VRPRSPLAKRDQQQEHAEHELEPVDPGGELRLGGEEVDLVGGRSHRDMVHAQGPTDQVAPASVDVHVIVRAGWSV
jgi:hypothetical protein